MFYLYRNGHISQKLLELQKLNILYVYPVSLVNYKDGYEERSIKGKQASKSTIKTSLVKRSALTNLFLLIPDSFLVLVDDTLEMKLLQQICFVDHKSDFGYSSLCISTSQEETLKSKAAFEKLTDSYGVLIKSYYVDNGRFL